MLLKPWQTKPEAQAHLAIRCKHCGAEGAVKYGTSGRAAPKQRFLCRACDRTFVSNNAPPGMRYPADTIASALNQFYESASLHKIRRGLALDRQQTPDHSAIYRWVARYTKRAVEILDEVPLHNVGNIWVADETVLKLKWKGGENVWFWDVIDEETRFLLASRITPNRLTADARDLLIKARNRASARPEVVATDKLRQYVKGTQQAFGRKGTVIHLQSGPFAKTTISTRAIERLHGTIKDRTKVMRALANRETARLVMDGWRIHYNFFRPHSGLGGMTPAEAAGAKTRFRSWGDIVRHTK